MTPNQQIEDWIARIALGDRDAFTSLYGATSAKLFSVAVRVLNDRAESEEALQEIYLRIWDKAGMYAVNGLSPMTWLITLARNHAIDRLRKRARVASRMEHADLVPDSAPGPAQAAEASLEAVALGRCLEELPPDRAQAVRGAYLDGASYAELAAHFDVPVNTMRTWLRRSLIKLKECLSR